LNQSQAKSGGSANSVLKQSLTQQTKTGERISELGETLQQERVQQAEVKVVQFEQLKRELGIAVCRLRMQCEEVR